MGRKLLKIRKISGGRGKKITMVMDADRENHE